MDQIAVCMDKGFQVYSQSFEILRLGFDDKSFVLFWEESRAMYEVSDGAMKSCLNLEEVIWVRRQLVGFHPHQ